MPIYTNDPRLSKGMYLGVFAFQQFRFCGWTCGLPSFPSCRFHKDFCHHYCWSIIFVLNFKWILWYSSKKGFGHVSFLCSMSLSSLLSFPWFHCFPCPSYLSPSIFFTIPLAMLFQLSSLLTPLSIHCPCLHSCHFHHSPQVPHIVTQTKPHCPSIVCVVILPFPSFFSSTSQLSPKQDSNVHPLSMSPSCHFHHPPTPSSPQVLPIVTQTRPHCPSIVCVPFLPFPSFLHILFIVTQVRPIVHPLFMSPSYHFHHSPKYLPLSPKEDWNNLKAMLHLVVVPCIS